MIMSHSITQCKYKSPTASGLLIAMDAQSRDAFGGEKILVFMFYIPTRRPFVEYFEALPSR